MPVPGGSESSAAPAPPQTVCVGALVVDRAPVTNARYAEFVAATGHRPPAFWSGGTPPRALLDHPVVGVDLFDALAFARWAGGNLPTEEEWLLASGLSDPRGYPWGPEFDARRCNTIRSGRKGTSPVGSYPPAPSGCVDLAGNVWELTCTRFPGHDDSIVVKGGSWYDYPAHAKLETRFRAGVTGRSATCGFRLVYGRPFAPPDWLPADVVQRAIEFRRAPPREAGSRAAAPEFLATLDALRETAEGRIAAIEGAVREAMGKMEGAVAGLASFFEEREGGGRGPKESENGPSRRWSLFDSKLTESMRRAFESHPALVAAALFVAAGLVVWSAFASAAASESPRAAVDWPLPAVPARPAADGPAPRALRLDEAIAAVLADRSGARADAERAILRLGEEARARIEAELRGNLTREAESTLRYLLAALDDAAATAAPRVVAACPGAGLFFFVDRADATAHEEARKARLTAAAESVPFLAVHVGPAEPEALAGAMAGALAGAEVYVDADGSFSAPFQLRRLPAHAGALASGRPTFAHMGPIPRAALAARCRALREAMRGW
jgi:hypothetical protein